MYRELIEKLNELRAEYNELGSKTILKYGLNNITKASEAGYMLELLTNEQYETIRKSVHNTVMQYDVAL